VGSLTGDRSIPFRLLKFALAGTYPEPRMFRAPQRLRGAYDAVIIGGGHGLAAARPARHEGQGMSERQARTTIVEWIDPTRPAVIGWLFAAMSESGQWNDLRLRVREGHPPRIVAIRYGRQGEEDDPARAA
jgi:hypothetical protein